MGELLLSEQKQRSRLKGLEGRYGEGMGGEEGGKTEVEI